MQKEQKMNKKRLAALAAVVMSACMGCKAEIPPYLIVDGTAVVGHTDKLPAKLVIPKGITEIGKNAFYDCESLAKLTIGNGVETIGEWAFAGCKSLTSLTIPDSVTENYRPSSAERRLSARLRRSDLSGNRKCRFSLCSSFFCCMCALRCS